MIGIIGAMEKEVVELKKVMEIDKEIEYIGQVFLKGKIQDTEVVVVRSGIGKVNAAACTQLLVDKFGVNCIINTGVAGALHPELNVGDIIISKDTIQHDVDASIFGHPAGEIPGMDISIFEADSKLVGLAEKAGKNKSYNIMVGRVLTGDQGIGDFKKKEFLHEHFQGHCVEMEGGAIAQTCFLNSIPFLLIRSISDNADHSVKVDYYEFVKKAAKNASELLTNMLSLYQK